MKKIVLLSIIIGTLLFSCCANAEELHSRVFDNVGIITDLGESSNEQESLHLLETLINDSREKYGFDIAILTLSDFIGYDTHETLAESFYRSMSLGIGSNKSGILFVVDCNQELCYIYAHGDCLNWLSEQDKQIATDRIASAIWQSRVTLEINLATAVLFWDACEEWQSVQ